MEKQKKEVISHIKFMRSAQHEEMYRVFMDALSTYLKCLTTFGINNPYTKECFNVVKEMRQSLKEEKKLLRVLNDHSDWINIDDLNEIISMLDEVAEDTYYDDSDILENIYTSCEAKDKERIVRPNKPINSLLTNKEYKNKVYDLVQKGTMSK